MMDSVSVFWIVLSVLLIAGAAAAVGVYFGRDEMETPARARGMLASNQCGVYSTSYDDCIASLCRWNKQACYPTCENIKGDEDLCWQADCFWRGDSKTCTEYPPCERIANPYDCKDSTVGGLFNCKLEGSKCKSK